VDIYNVTSNICTTATLSLARAGLAATSVANRWVIFAGGHGASGPSNTVDIFDSLNKLWNISTLSQARFWFAATSINNLAFLEVARSS
jgi:hypothetical protein